MYLAESGVALIDVYPQQQLEIVELMPVALLQLIQRQTSCLRTWDRVLHHLNLHLKTIHQPVPEVQKH